MNGISQYSGNQSSMGDLAYAGSGMDMTSTYGANQYSPSMTDQAFAGSGMGMPGGMPADMPMGSQGPGGAYEPMSESMQSSPSVRRASGGPVQEMADPSVERRMDTGGASVDPSLDEREISIVAMPDRMLNRYDELVSMGAHPHTAEDMMSASSDMMANDEVPMNSGSANDDMASSNSDSADSGGTSSDTAASDAASSASSAAEDCAPADESMSDDSASDSTPTEAETAESGADDCEPAGEGPADSEPADSGSTDGGSTDSGSTDCPTDSGPTDGGPTDAGPTDGGPTDAGPTDGGPTNTGPTDAGPTDGGDIDRGNGNGAAADVDVEALAKKGENTKPEDVEQLFEFVGPDAEEAKQLLDDALEKSPILRGACAAFIENNGDDDPVTVHTGEDLGNYAGIAYFGGGDIALDSRLSGDQMQSTLVHEIGHSLLNLKDSELRQDDEPNQEFTTKAMEEVQPGFTDRHDRDGDGIAEYGNGG
ncbi:MAG: hypothetical protein HWE20_09855 [Gammaproteobacteria bacterium]|nr:hypothetical protein [Gammaproteobacteria bacterium]